ncbi:hypothetical protein V6N13_109288 [Hibiscus sabdariffa]|uniref:Uncharacterized protein n=1 Tax=Hibiscus sabdariffa TaxID=183260 RepID=A0ABR2FP57_9ROSI
MAYFVQPLTLVSLRIKIQKSNKFLSYQTFPSSSLSTAYLRPGAATCLSLLRQYLLIKELLSAAFVTDGFFLPSIPEQSSWSKNNSLLGACCQLGICSCRTGGHE